MVPPPWGLRGGGGQGGRGGGKGATPPAYARIPPRDGVLYDELEVHWGATARYGLTWCMVMCRTDCP